MASFVLDFAQTYKSLRPMQAPIPSRDQIERLIEALPPHLAALARRGEVRRYAKGDLIMREGELGGTLHVLLSGSVKGFAEDAEAREITFGIDSAGDFFGEMSLDGGLRSASVVALEPTVCAVLTQHTVWQQVSADPRFARALIERVIARGRFATEVAKSLALDTVYARLKRFLEQQAGEGEFPRRIEARLTHQEIANRVGASREMISRLMRDLGQGGYIEAVAGSVVLLKRLPERW